MKFFNNEISFNFACLAYTCSSEGSGMSSDADEVGTEVTFRTTNIIEELNKGYFRGYSVIPPSSMHAIDMLLPYLRMVW